MITYFLIKYLLIDNIILEIKKGNYFNKIFSIICFPITLILIVLGIVADLIILPFYLIMMFIIIILNVKGNDEDGK